MLRGARAFDLPGGVDVVVLGADFDGQAIVAAAAAGLSAFATMTGLAALHATVRASAADVLTPSPPVRSWGRRGLRDVMLAAQVAVAVVLVTGALVFVASLRAALALNAPVAMETALSARIDLTPQDYDPMRAASAFAGVQARLSAHPSIAAVASSVGAVAWDRRGISMWTALPDRFRPLSAW